MTQPTAQQEREAYLHANKTAKGGWTKDFLESIGVSWPPQSGWKQRFIKSSKHREGKE